jgi:hypothetical protein
MTQRYEVGGRPITKASAPDMGESVEQQKNVDPETGEKIITGDAWFHKQREMREQALAKSNSTAIRDIDRNIQTLQQSIARLDGERNPSPMLGQMRSAVEALIKKKIELTNGSQLQDSVVDAEEYKQDVIDRYNKGEASKEELLETGDKKILNQRVKEQAYHNTYRYEELFQENIDGDIILTFPDEVLKRWNLKEGDSVGLSATKGSLVIKKI